MKQRDKSGATRTTYLNRSFVLLWQGHFISSIGTVMYGIALGFWLLEKTGSTAKMAFVSASVMMPRLLIGPFAGIVVDRLNKKWLMVMTDLLAGIVILGVAALVFLDMFDFRVAFASGLLIGALDTFAWPTIATVLPLIVPAEDLSRANAAYSAANSGSSLLGRAVSGYLMKAIGAPLLFLVNGITYLYSAVSEAFIQDLPSGIGKGRAADIIGDIREGAAKVVEIPGLLFVFVCVAFLNFFGYMVMILYVPLFAGRADLGPALYGIVMATSTAGALLGHALYARFKILANRRLLVFSASGIASNLLIVFFPYVGSVAGMLVVIFLAGLTSAGINIVLTTALQLSIPREFQGRVFSLMGMLGGLLVPLAMVLGGILAESLDVQFLISACALCLSLIFAYPLFTRNAKSFFEKA